MVVGGLGWRGRKERAGGRQERGSSVAQVTEDIMRSPEAGASCRAQKTIAVIYGLRVAAEMVGDLRQYPVRAGIPDFPASAPASFPISSAIGLIAVIRLAFSLDGRRVTAHQVPRVSVGTFQAGRTRGTLPRRTAPTVARMRRRCRPISRKLGLVLLVIAILLFLIFGGLGFALHILWLGLILAVIIGVAHALTGSGRRRRI